MKICGMSGKYNKSIKNLKNSPIVNVFHKKFNSILWLQGVELLEAINNDLKVKILMN